MTEMRQLILDTAAALEMDPRVLATMISYETAGTFDPTKAGPTTQWGQHRGLIQFGEPQAAQYGADFTSPESAIRSQLGPDGAVVKYFRGNGWKPGMSELDAYSIINAGAPGRHNASDANNGGAPGTVADKVKSQFGPHRQKADAFLGAAWAPSYTAGGPEAVASRGRSNASAPSGDTAWRDRVRGIFQGAGQAEKPTLAGILAQAEPPQSQQPPMQFAPRPGYQAPEDSIARAYRMLNQMRGGQA